MEHIGNQIAELRKKYRLSQREFGERIGLSSQAVSQIEKDGTTKNSTLKKIEQEFGVSFSISGNATTQSDLSFWRSMVDEYKEREKHYRETISQLTAQLGKPLGNLEAVVGSYSGKCRVVRLQSRLHRLRQAS